MLEHFGIVRVDLLGKTYDSVTWNDRPIEDPFQVVESSRQGAIRSLPVVEVVRSLWIQTDTNGATIVRQGKVCC